VKEPLWLLEISISPNHLTHLKNRARENLGCGAFDFCREIQGISFAGLKFFAVILEEQTATVAKMKIKVIIFDSTPHSLDRSFLGGSTKRQTLHIEYANSTVQYPVVPKRLPTFDTVACLNQA
jgi:hypothetical protein